MIPSQVKEGASAAAMLMERTTRFVKIVALPLGKKSDGLAVKPWVLCGVFGVFRAVGGSDREVGLGRAGAGMRCGV